SRFRSGYLNLFGAAGDDPLYAAVSEGARRQGMEHFLPLFYTRMETLFDYLPEDSAVFLDHHAKEARAERLTLTTDAYEARREASQGRGGSAYRALPVERLYLNDADWRAALAPRPVRRFSP